MHLTARSQRHQEAGCLWRVSSSGCRRSTATGDGGSEANREHVVIATEK